HISNLAIHLDQGAQPDSSVHGIILMNAAVIAAAWFSGEGLLMLLWPYWIQSLVIGDYNVRRIQKLQDFSTDNFRINDRAVQPSPATRRSTWMFFAFHYGGFHLVYLIFLLAFSAMGAETGSVPVTMGSSGEVVDFEVG